MAGTSATVTYNSMRVDTFGELLMQGYKVQIGDHFFSFRLDIGVRNFNLVNEFVSITKLENGRINLQITNLWQSKLTKAVKSQSTLRKSHENAKIFKRDCYLPYAKYQLHVEWWKICVILLFLIAADWLSPIIVSKVFCIWFFGIAV